MTTTDKQNLSILLNAIWDEGSIADSLVDSYEGNPDGAITEWNNRKQDDSFFQQNPLLTSWLELDESLYEASVEERLTELLTA